MVWEAVRCQSSWSGLINADFWPIFALLERKHNIKPVAGGIPQARSREFRRGNLLRQLVMIGVDLLDHSQKSFAAGHINLLSFTVIEQIIRIAGNRSAG